MVLVSGILRCEGTERTTGKLFPGEHCCSFHGTDIGESYSDCDVEYIVKRHFTASPLTKTRSSPSRLALIRIAGGHM